MIEEKYRMNQNQLGPQLKFTFSKKATKIDKIFTVTVTLWHLLHNLKLKVKVSPNFVAFLENINFNTSLWSWNICGLGSSN